MLELLALEPADGWAFVRDRSSIRFIRPPYRTANARPVSEAVVSRAVTEHEFVPSDLRFDNWAALIDHLRREIVRARENAGRPSPEGGVGRALLRHAPRAKIEQFLDRVRDELIPDRAFAAANEVLIAILAASPHAGDEEVLRRAVELLDAVEQQRKKAAHDLVEDVERFPTLARHGRKDAAEHLGEQIRAHGSLFTPTVQRVA